VVVGGRRTRVASHAPASMLPHCPVSINSFDFFFEILNIHCRTEFATAEAVQGEVERLRAEMFTMRIKFAKREEYQPAQYKALRKRVAQLLTIQRERSVAEGVSTRDARAAEKRRLVEAGLGQF
jgi:ribosomal protein L29